MKLRIQELLAKANLARLAQRKSKPEDNGRIAVVVMTGAALAMIGTAL